MIFILFSISDFTEMISVLFVVMLHSYIRFEGPNLKIVYDV